MINWKKKIKYGALLFSSAALLIACGDDLADTGDAEGEEDVASEDGSDLEVELDEEDDSTLFIGMTNAPDSFTPFSQSAVAGTWAQRFFYDSILSMPTPDEFQPRLGTLETEDNQVFTIAIHEEATWTDGEPVTSHDVAFTVNTIAHPDVATNLGTNIAMIEGTTGAGELEEGLDEVTGLEIIDDKTIEITTKQPVDLAFMSEFFGHNVLIAPEHVFSEIPLEDIATSEASTQPSVFSGAFQFVNYEEEDYLHLEKNPDYHLGEPAIDNVYMRVMSGTALLTEFQAENLHMAAGGGIGMVSHEDIDLLLEIDGLVVDENPSFNGQYMIINNESPRFEDPEVRRAIAHALNLNLTVENLLHGRGEALASTYSSASPYQDPDLEPLEYDPELAQQMLEDAGFDFDEPIEFVVPTGNVIREQNGDLIEQWLVDIGLTVNQSNYDFTTWLEHAREGNYDLGLMGWAHTVDPNIQTYFYSGASSNNMRFSDSHVDDLVDQGNALTTFDERYPIYQELQHYLQEVMPAIPLYSDSQFGVKVDYLDGGIDEYWGGSLHDLHEWELNP